jgi:hypothetical protein
MQIYTQWSTPVLIDSSSQVSWPIIAVSPKDRQIAVVSFNTVYISEDLGKTFERRCVFQPPVTYWHMFYPGGIAYDTNGALWVLWFWDECSDNECTFSIDYWAYLSKSTDSGKTFQHVIRQKRGLAGVGNTPSSPLLKISNDNTVHFLYDSLPRLGEIYKLGNDLTYCKLPNGDTTQRVDVRLPQLADSLDYQSYINMSVSPKGRLHVIINASGKDATWYYQLYSHSFIDGAFLAYRLVDSINPQRQFKAKSTIKPTNELLFTYLLGKDPKDSLSADKYLARISMNDGDTLSFPVEIVPSAYNISIADSQYWYAIRWAPTQWGYMFYQFTDYRFLPVDSAFIGYYSDLQLATDNMAGKYIIMNDNNWKAYLTMKDVINEVIDDSPTIPREINLRCAPNPFNGTTKLYLTLPRAGRARIALYDLLGNQLREIANDSMSGGEHRYVLDAESLASGVYLVKMQFETINMTAKIMLLK